MNTLDWAAEQRRVHADLAKAIGLTEAATKLGGLWLATHNAWIAAARQQSVLVALGQTHDFHSRELQVAALSAAVLVSRWLQLYLAAVGPAASASDVRAFDIATSSTAMFVQVLPEDVVREVRARHWHS